MKRLKGLKTVLAAVLIALAACALFGCDNAFGGGTKKFDSSVKLVGKTVTYDGTEQELELSGKLPKGAKVTYENNGQVNAGEYVVKVTVTCDGYETKTYTAKLKIDKADFKMDGIEFNGKRFFYKSGTERKIELTKNGKKADENNFPTGTEINYENNKKNGQRRVFRDGYHNEP